MRAVTDELVVEFNKGESRAVEHDVEDDVSQVERRIWGSEWPRRSPPHKQIKICATRHETRHAQPLSFLSTTSLSQSSTCLLAMQRPQNPKPASVTAKEEESESADVLMLTDAENPRQSRRRSRRRITTVYDAVAGKKRHGAQDGVEQAVLTRHRPSLAQASLPR